MNTMNTEKQRKAFLRRILPTAVPELRRILTTCGFSMPLRISRSCCEWLSTVDNYYRHHFIYAQLDLAGDLRTAFDKAPRISSSSAIADLESLASALSTYAPEAAAIHRNILDTVYSK